MKKRTRLLALVLTVLMVVGMMPMSVFAIKTEANASGNAFEAPTAQDIIESWYKSDSAYWEPIYKQNSTNKYTSSATGIQASAGATRSNGSIVLGTDQITFLKGQGLDNTSETHRYVDVFAGAWNTLVKSDLAGLDIAVNFKLKVEAGSTGTAKASLQYGNRAVTHHGKTAVQFDPAAVYDAGNRKVADLSTTEWVDVTFLVDLGGPTATQSGNTMYLFINGELVSASAIFTEAELDTIYTASAGQGTQYIQGAALSYIRFNFTGYETAGYVFDDFGVYYYDDTPDGNVKNATRSANTLSYYNDFDALTSVNLAPPVTHIGNINVQESANFKVVEQGEGDKALQLGSDSPNTNKTFLNPLSNRGNFRNAGKSFVMSVDVTSVNGKFVSGDLFSIVMRNSSGSIGVDYQPVHITADGTFYYGTLSEETTLVKLGEGETANISIRADVKNNKCYIYVDGVEKTGGIAMLSESQLNTAKGIHANGFSFDDGKLYYMNNFDTSVKVAFDNATFYYSDNYVGAYTGEGEAWRTPDLEELYDTTFGIGDTPSDGLYLPAAHGGGTTTTTLGTNDYMMYAGNNSYFDFRNRGVASDGDMSNNKGGILDTAGLDIKLEMEMMFKGAASTTSGFAGIRNRGYNGTSVDTGYLKLDAGVLKLDTSGCKDALIDAISGETFKPTDGVYYRYVTYIDVGGTSASDTGNQISILVYDMDGMLVAFALNKTFLSSADLTKVFTQTANLENKGFIFTQVRVQNGTGVLEIGLRNIYTTYSADNTRGSENFSVAFYEDFDRFTQGNTINNTTSDIKSALGNQINYASAVDAPSYKYVDDGNGGNSLAFIASNVKADGGSMDRYVNAYPQQVTQGKNIISSIDIKLGDVDNITTGIFQYINRGTAIGNQFIQVGAHIASDKLYYKYYEGDTEKRADICSLSDSVFTTYTLELDASANKAWIYINGVLKTPAEGFQPIASAIFSGMGNTVHANEIRAFQFGTKGYTLEIDNFFVYVADEYKFVNNAPMDGIITNPDDGYLYYYDNGVPVADYTAPDGVLRTDRSGAIVIKERTSFIDWDKSIGGSVANAPKGQPQWGTTTYNMVTYYQNLISKDYSSLKLWNFYAADANKTLTIKESVKTPVTTVNGTVLDKKALDLTQYDYLELDFYTEGFMEYRNYLMFNFDGTYNTANGSGYIGWQVDYGTNTYNGVTGYSANGKETLAFGNPNYTFYGNQWTTATISLESYGTYNRIGADYVGKDAKKGEYIESKSLATSFVLNTTGWSMDRLYTADGKAYAINGDTYTFFIKDFYLVKNVKVTSLDQVYDISGAGDKVPAAAVGYSGLYTAESGNKYFYSAEDHAMVSNGNYDIPLTKNTYGKSNVVTGYAADANGVLTPINGKAKVQTLRTHYYVNGVKQYGDPDDNYKYTATDGTVYRINGEGDCTAYVAPAYGKIGYSESALKAGAVSANFENDGRPESWSRGVGGYTEQDKYGLRYASKNIWSLESAYESGTSGNKVLVLTQHAATVDEFIDKTNSTSTKYSYFETDIKLGDDWNGKINLGADGSSGNGGGFGITENGLLTDRNGNAMYQLGDYWTKVTVINVFDSAAGTVTYNLYVNGLLLKSEVVQSGKSGWYVKQYRFGQDGVYTTDNRQGTIYFDNMTIAYSNDDAYATAGPVVNGLVEIRNGDVYEGYYYTAGALQTSKKIEVETGKYYLAEADGKLVKGTELAPVQLYAVENKYYAMDGYVGELANGLEADGRYYIDGALMSGLFTPNASDAPNGEKWYADADNKVVINATKYTLSDGKVADIVNKVVTIRDGFYVEGAGTATEYANIYADGILNNTVGFITLNEKQYYIESADGTIVKRTANAIAEIAGKIYMVGADGYEVKIADGLFIFNEGAADEYANLYIDGVLQTTEGMIEYKGNYYFVTSTDGKLFKEGIKLTEGVSCGFADYVGVVLHEQEYEGKYYINGAVVKDQDITSPDGSFYCADANGNLYGNGLYVAHDGKWYMFAADYKGVIANGVMSDATHEDRYYDNGVIIVNADITAPDGSFYCADENGKLYANGLYVAHDGKWYMFAADYKGVIANGIMSDATYAARYFTNGVVTIGFFTAADKIYITDADGYLLTGKQVVSAHGNRVYDFDATTYAGTMRDNYAVIENLYWVDGYTINGIHDVPVQGGTEEMYFINGTPSAGEIPVSDGTVHVFGEDGKRVVEEGETEPEDKAPQAIWVTLQYKTVDGVTKISERFLYQFWNTDLTYVAPYNGCYAVSIKVIVDGVETVYDASEVTIENVQADYEIIVTYDQTVSVHDYKLIKTDAPTCNAAGKEYYECVDCGATNTKDIEIVADAHKYASVSTPATCATNGKTVFTCEYCGDTYTVYSAKLAHTWVEDTDRYVAPTCGQTGKRYYDCACGATKTVTVAATGDHNWDTVNVDHKDPGCSLNGYDKYTCTVCGKVQTVVIPATGAHVHDPASTPHEELTDLATGNVTKLYNCAVCGKEGCVVVVVPAPAPAPDEE